MSTLTYSDEHLPMAERVEVTPSAGRRGFWRRVADRFVASQQRRAEREIARYLASRGGMFTDDTEREIMARLTGASKRSV